MAEAEAWKLTWVVLEGALLVGRLQLCLGGIWRHAEDVVELLVFDHGRDCRGRVEGVEGLVGVVELRPLLPD